MAYPADPEDLEVGFAFGASFADDPTGLVYEAVTPDSPRGPLTITRGRVGDGTTTDPTGIRTDLNDPDGEFSPRNVAGSRYATLRQDTPMQVRVDVGAGLVVRGRAAVASWNPRWDGPDVNDRVPVEAYGVLSYLGRDQTVMSALHRTIADASPENYWRLEDGTDSTEGGSAVTNGSTMHAEGVVEFGAVSDLVGSLPTPDVSAGTLVAEVVGVGDTSWYVEFAWLGPFASDSIVKVPTGGTGLEGLRFLVASGVGDPQVEVLIAAEAGTTVGSSLTAPNADATWPNVWHHVACTVVQNGANVDLELFVDGVSVDTGSVATTIGQPQEWWGNHNQPTGSAATSFSHVVVGNGTARTDAPSAMDGWAGEPAADRIARTCAEAGVPVDVTAGDSEPMGPQLPGSLLAILRDCEAVDAGMLVERLDGRLGYDPRATFYNADVAWTIDFDTLAGLDPFDDNRDLYNVVTVDRPNGASATAVADDGPVGTDTSVGVGPRPLPVSRNVASDLHLTDQAGWILRRGTLNKPRYVVTLKLSTNPDLIDNWLGCDLGARIQIDGAPAKHVGPNILDLILVGYVEVLDAADWITVLFLEPYDWYAVGEYGSATAGGTGPDRYGGEGTQLFTAVTGSALTFRVIPGDRRWTQDAADFDPDLRLVFTDAGWPDEIIDVSSIALGGSFIGAGTAAHGNNASVAPTAHASTAVGDTMYLLAAIRNSGTGTVNTISGWDSQAQFGNMRLFSRHADGTAADNPTVTFTGGVANATTSAQIATFRGTSSEIDTTATQLNGSAGNIAHPGLTVDVDCALVLGMTWKQDDYTSVAPPFGNEIAEASTTTGDDQSLYWWYQLQTDRSQVQAGTITVSGGASAISRAVLVVFPGTQLMTVSARAVNGVEKEHAAGTQIRLAKDAIYGL